MPSPQFSPFPHLSWLGSWVSVGGRVATLEIHQRQVNHLVIYSRRARADVRWIRRGREERFTVDDGSVRFCPADGEEHVTIGRCQPGHEFFTLLIPREHLRAVAEAEGIARVPELRHSVSRRDAVLSNSMRRIAGAAKTADALALEDQEAAAQALILRLFSKNGWRGPDWKNDNSVFDRSVLHRFVDFIDEHLRQGVSVSDLASLAAMSPGHFAKKFRHSTGQSLQRFVNYRRICRSLSLLQGGPGALPSGTGPSGTVPSGTLRELAIDLGFSSHSHFTRTFTSIMGMTPEQYRAQYKRVIG